MANKNFYEEIEKTPAVTVIIPMYNTEKYIGECLQSLVNQTFQNFDVIVVNDCSTDNSVAEAEKFLPKLKGRLKIKTLPKNSGTSALPKNTGIQMARSKYVTFLDSDDYITPTALEELFKIAEETDAEVIHCSQYFTFKDGENEIKTETFQKTCHVNKPTFETLDIGKRVKKFTERGFLWWGQCKLYRRDFLIKNKIVFPPIDVWEDMVFSFQCVILAKNYVRVPNVFYYYRVRKDSLSHIPQRPLRIIEMLMQIINYLDDFISRVEFFQKNPQYRFMILDWHVQERMNIICTAFFENSKLQPFQIEELFRKKFENAISKEDLPFSSYFFTVAAYQRFCLYNMTQEKNQLQQKISDLEMNLAKYKVNSFSNEILPTEPK